VQEITANPQDSNNLKDHHSQISCIPYFLYHEIP